MPTEFSFLCVIFPFLWMQGVKVGRLLGDEPQMVFAGSNVNLTITTECLTIMNIEDGDVCISYLHSMTFSPTSSFISVLILQKISCQCAENCYLDYSYLQSWSLDLKTLSLLLQVIGIHHMPCISFASGGDPVSRFDNPYCLRSLSSMLIQFIPSGHTGFCGLRRQGWEWQTVSCAGVWRGFSSGCDHYYWASVWAPLQAVLSPQAPSYLSGEVSLDYNAQLYVSQWLLIQKPLPMDVDHRTMVLVLTAGVMRMSIIMTVLVPNPLILHGLPQTSTPCPDPTELWVKW